MYPENTVSFYSPTMFLLYNVSTYIVSTYNVKPYNISTTSSMMTVKIKMMGIDIDIPFTAGYSIVGKRGI